MCKVFKFIFKLIRILAVAVGALFGRVLLESGSEAAGLGIRAGQQDL